MSTPTSPSRSILSTTDANISPQKPTSASPSQTTAQPKNQPATSENQSEAKSMDYHRQVLKEKLDDSSNGQKYVSPSDGIMSPCTQKLSALKGRQFGKAKPKSLFAQTAGKNVDAKDLEETIGVKKE